MDPEQRIAALEQQVQELSRQVRALSSGSRATPAPAAHVEPPARKPPKPKRGDLRGGIDRFLGGEAGETIESRVGGIWLIRLAVVLVMTAAVLGVRLTIHAEVLGPAQKLAILYSCATAAVAYGLMQWRSKSFFPQTLLGAGLAGLYFATFAAFFVDTVRISTDLRIAVALLPVCLVALIAVCHLRRSPTVAGIAFFLVYYTVVMSCMGGKSAENIYYALITSAEMAFAVLIFHAAHRWLLFTWAALIATHATYLYFFHVKPMGLAMPDREYFWLSNGFLTLCYLAFALAGILDARKTNEYRRGVGQMAGVNSCVYLVLMWIAIRHYYVEYEWAFRLGIAGELCGLGVLARLTGPRRNYLYQIYAAKSIVMFTLALQAYFSGAMLMVAISVECLGLAFSYQRSGIVMFKAMELGLLAIAFAGCLFHVKAPGWISTGYFDLRTNWFCCAGSAAAFMVVSWFYDHFVRRIKPEDRTVRSQWHLADTFLDIRSSTAALLHAAGAALILLTITIVDQGSNPLLPYLLGGEGVLMAVAGLILRTPQLEIGGVLLVAAAHVSYHASLMFGVHGFETQPNYAQYTILLALVTFAGAYFWEAYLRRAQGGRPWEHHAIAALPYLAATFMLTTLIGRQFAGIHVPLAQNMVGVVLLLAGVLTRYTGVKASGLLALGIGAWTLCNGLYFVRDAFLDSPDFVPYLILFLSTFVVGERLFVILQQRKHAASRAEDFLRVVLASASALFGVLGFSEYARTEYVTLIWLALAISEVLLGVIFYESRYRWIGIALFGIATGRAFAVDLLRLPPVFQFLSFAALGLLLLIVSWGYTRYRNRLLQSNEERLDATSQSDG